MVQICTGGPKITLCWRESHGKESSFSDISKSSSKVCVYFYRSNSRMNGCALVRPNLRKNRFMSAQTYFLTSLPSLSAPCLSQSSLDGFFVIFKSVVINANTNTSSNCLYICHGLWALLRFISIRFAQRRLTDRSPQQPVWFGALILLQVERSISCWLTVVTSGLMTPRFCKSHIICMFMHRNRKDCSQTQFGAPLVLALLIKVWVHPEQSFYLISPKV